MTDFAAAADKDGRNSRLSGPIRITLLAVAGIALVVSVGVIMGVVAALFEQEAAKPIDLLVLAGAAGIAALLGWVCWRLTAYWRQAERSAYERRYTRTMLVLVCAGLPIGLLLGMAGNDQPHDALWSNAPLDPTLAGIAAAGLVIILAGTLVIYHRSIDDHEQKAYLWANSLAFYFLALALPAAWLLARGGLIGPIGIGTAMLLLLAAFVVNFTVWAWLKYR